MTTSATQFPLIGSQPVGNFFTPDNVQRHPLGAGVTFNDPQRGGGEAIYLAIPVSTAYKVGQAVVWDQNFASSLLPNTANLGQSVGFALNANASNASAVQYGWFAISGSVLAASTASVAANTAVGIAGAGLLGANTAGKQILDARVLAPATTTVVKAGTTTNGSPRIRVNTTDGWFVGMALSGTGIPGATTVLAIDPNNFELVLSANATASGAPSLTGTYNDGVTFWNTVVCDRPFTQGAIT